MVIHNKQIVVYDIEIFPNLFCCTCKNTETQEFKIFRLSMRYDNELKALVDFFTDPNYLFCGYNNKHYDDVIINYIIYHIDTLLQKEPDVSNLSLFNLSKYIISSEEEEHEAKKLNKYKYANYFESMDLLTMMFSSKLRVGLKEMQVTMHYDNVLEYEKGFDKCVIGKDVDKVIEYNINDVNSTEKLLKILDNKGEIELRLFIEKEYGINALSMDSVKFGETILAKKICEQMRINKKQLEQMRSPMDYIPLKDVILPFIKYKNPKLQEVLEDMKKQVVYSRERKGYEKMFIISGTTFSVGVGGIHSINTPEIFVPRNDEYIGHVDAASMYPSFIVRYGWFPRHLGKNGLGVYESIYHERLDAKHSGQKIKDKALKLLLNSVTGKMQQETSWMYDPLSVFKIRINGQLILLMLVDILLEHSCRIVQVNTDGVMFVAKCHAEKDIMESISKLENITKLEFEADRYERFYQLAVNDYFGVVNGFSQSRDPKLIQRKGWFITENVLGKGLAPVIIPKAVINYFINNVPIEKTIKESDNILDFLMTQRVDKKFKVEYNDKFIQRINRYYASNDGYFLYKYDPETDKYTNMLKKSAVTIVNKFDEKVDKSCKNKNINYAYYLSEARKIINELKCVQLELFK